MSDQRVKLGMGEFVYEGPGRLDCLSWTSDGRLQLTISDIHITKDQPTLTFITETPPKRRGLWEWIFG